MERRQFVGCAGLASMTALAGHAVAQDATDETGTPARGVKITVLKTTAQKEFEQYRGGQITPCDRFKEGQEFVVEVPWYPPEGFCDWAWADIHKDIMAVLFGSNDPWIKQPGTAITCCTDGLRPVIFKVERVE